MKIFVISLPDSDRRSIIDSSLSSLGLDFEFFDAKDPGFVKKNEHLISRKKMNFNVGWNVDDYCFGASLSHAFLYKKIVDEKIENAIILEDDAILNDDFAKLVNGFYLENSGYDFILLCYINLSFWKFIKKIPLFGKFNFIKFMNIPGNAAAYFVNHVGAKKMLENIFPISDFADWPKDISKINSAAIYPRIVNHPPITEENSFIEKQRKKAKNAKKKNGLRKFIYEISPLFVFPCLFFPRITGGMYRVYKLWFGFLINKVCKTFEVEK